MENSLDIKRNEVLADHCRFGVGGPADFFVEVNEPEEVREAILYAKQNDLAYFIYGGGSNIFFDDRGFRGLVIKIGDGSFQMLDGERVKVDAGYPLPKLVRELAKLDRGGLEFLANIPGSVGGALVGNAGCYGRSIQEALEAAEVYSVERDEISTWQPEDFGFDYRHSCIKQDPDKVVLSAVLKTIPRPTSAIEAEIEKELDDRKQKHPHTAQCAGSFFKNQEGKAAWRVITDAGMEDACVGDACLSEKHANFLVNRGQATSADILSLARKIQQVVLEKAGVGLEPEVRYVGEHGLEKI